MKTLEEFTKEAASYTRVLHRNNAIFSWGSVGAIGLMAVVGGLTKGCSDFVANVGLIGSGFVLISFVFGGAIFLPVYHRKLARRLGLVCPTCQAVFIKPEMQLVITTRNCPHCGKSAVSS